MVADGVQTSATPEYIREIDRYYRGHRGPGAVLSRADFDCIDRWARLGLPLELVLAGISEAFARSGSRIHGIAYCEGFIKKRRRPTRTAEVPKIDLSKVRDYLEELARRVEVVAGLEGIAGGIRELDESGSFPALEQELGRFESLAVEILRGASSIEDLNQVSAAVESDMRDLRTSLTAGQRENLEQKLWQRKLLDAHQLPRLSLFYLLS